MVENAQGKWPTGGSACSVCIGHIVLTSSLGQYVIVAMVSAAAMNAGLGASIYNRTPEDFFFHRLLHDLCLSAAIAQIESDLHATAGQLSLTLSLFILMQGVIPLVWSSIAEVQGRKVNKTSCNPELVRTHSALIDCLPGVSNAMHARMHRSCHLEDYPGPHGNAGPAGRWVSLTLCKASQRTHN